MFDRLVCEEFGLSFCILNFSPNFVLGLYLLAYLP